MATQYYVYGEDLIAGCIGPFNTTEEAQAHIAFCQARGDADPGKVITQEEYDALDDIFTLTPEEDRKWKFPEEN